MISGAMLRDAIISASGNLSNHRQEVDALNIFPVPDGDTGTNMSMTIGAAAREIAKVNDDDDITVAADIAASALLRGARGNSGVILSLIFRGIAKGLKDKKQADGKDIALALDKGVKAAYKAVMKPTEGTILTVIRMAAQEAENLSKDENDPIKVWSAVCLSANEALQKTPDQLPVLKKAGVVDAGGQGLVYILNGMKSVFESGKIISDESNNSVAPVSTPKKSVVGSASADIEFGYCSEFLIERDKGNTNDPLALRAYLESIGDCVVVVDDDTIIKVHVHSNQPGNVIQKALTYGQLINIKIDNMRFQHRNADNEQEIEENEQVQTQNVVAKPENDYGFVAVAAGEGVQGLFTDLGIDNIVSGGQTMNPSTDDILNAVLATPAKDVFVLPNNKNIIMAAEQAIPLVNDRNVHVLQTKTIPQGISAMLAFDETISPEENHIQMMNSAKQVETGTVTFAARDSSFEDNKITEGQILGICNGKITYVEDDVIRAAYLTTKNLVKRGTTSFVTIIYGAETTEEQANELQRQLASKFTDVEITVVDGGQPVYYFIISVE